MDIVSALEEAQNPEEPRPRRNDAPTGFEYEWDGNEGVIKTPPLKERPKTWDQFIIDSGLDPEEVEVIEPVKTKGWDVTQVTIVDGQKTSRTVRHHSYEIKVQRRTPGFDVDHLVTVAKADAEKRRQAAKSPFVADYAFVVALGDLQLGKVDGDGVEGTVERFVDATNQAVERYLALAEGRPLYLFHLGDCLAPDTEIVTRRGVVPIGAVAGHEVEVKDGNGGWVRVLIKPYGRKRVARITWRSRRATKTVTASLGHEWVLTSGERVRTEDLRPGMSVRKGYARTSPWPGLSTVGVQAGFVFGDGTATDNGARAIFCGDKDEALLPWFPGVDVSERDGKGQRRTAARFPSSWKRVPDLGEGTSFLLGWLAGYFAADGCVDEHGGARLSSANRHHLEFVRSLCAVLGIDTYPIRTVRSTGRYNDSDLFEISLAARMLPLDFFLVPAHRARVAALEGKARQTATWVVESVVDAGEENTYCCEVPTTQTFHLADGLLTSNCIEGMVSQGGANTWRTSLTTTEQVDLYERLLLEQVKAFAEVAPKVVAIGVPGNHDEAHRPIHTYGDSWAIQAVRSVRRALELSGNYEHVTMHHPERDELVMALDVCGTRIGAAHGHQFGNAKEGWRQWWKDQDYARAPVGDVDILLAGHKHNLLVQETGTQGDFPNRLFIQTPALESGSQWWKHRKGEWGAPGIITMLAGDGRWSDLQVLR